MIIVETSAFTRRIDELLSDEDYREFQLSLIDDPLLGRLIPGADGLRKVRIPAKGHGKRGGARVIYYWAVTHDQILMLYVFPKNERADLSVDQIRIFKQIAKEEYP